jgi:hypothetical protein
VVLGGMIRRSNTKNENRVPWLGELPGIGSLFRYRTQERSKTELLVILTPHVVRCPADADFIWGVEAKKMDWTLPDVVKLQGTAPPHGPVPAPSWERHYMSINVQPQGSPPLNISPLQENQPPGVAPLHGPPPGVPLPPPGVPGGPGGPGGPGAPVPPNLPLPPPGNLPSSLPGPVSAAPRNSAPMNSVPPASPMPRGSAAVAPPMNPLPTITVQPEPETLEPVAGPALDRRPLPRQ